MRLYIPFLLSIVAAACGSDNGDVAPTLPGNLVLQVTVSENGSGKVDVVATADKANYYEIYFGDASPETPVRSNDGSESHTYAGAGTYTIRVQAHATAAAFIETSKTIEIKTPVDDDGYTTPESYNGMTLVWRDEFEGTAVNAADWTFETGAGGWGNQELQNYVTTNATVADGFLTITAKKEGSGYTSSRMKTAGKREFKYGRIDIRAQLPKGQGIWPALWMLGASFDDIGWPRCGEIDIMELVGGTGRDKTVHGTPHWYDSPAQEHASYSGDYSLASGIFADEFHVFSIIWDANKIVWYVDDIKFHEIDITPANLSELREPYFLIFNVAVGGLWPGSPDGTTVFPQRMVVDYVRVFQPN
jgi:beta-glucanase (GH16 family)